MWKRLKQAVTGNKKAFIKFVVLAVIVLLMIGLTIWVLPWIVSLKDEAGRLALQEFIHSRGVWGVFILLGVQILQVIVALIPGEPIEVIAGLLYGTFGGWAICTVGVLIGTAAIFFGVRALGGDFVKGLIDEKKFERFKFLQDSQRLEMLTFLLFFIPGTPKDMLTYFMPFTKIRPLTFFWISCVARIPSVLSSTFAGASIGEGKWMQTLLIFVGIGLIGLLGIYINNRFLNRMNRKKAASAAADEEKPE